MATRGPVPKRSTQRRRENNPAEGGDVERRAVEGEPVEVPEPDEGWHELAADWFASLAESGQSVFYEPSDWQQARVWAELLSRQLESGRPSSQMIAAWASGAAELLTTEGARRRARLELERVTADEEETGDVSELDEYRRRLKSS